jgi:hypothetical protein
MDLAAAADYIGPGAIEVPVFESEILDMVRREASPSIQRAKTVRATGHPHRYFEQTAIAQAGSVDPRNITATVTGPTRVERPVFIKAETAQTNIGLFDKDVTEQQGLFSEVVAKDIDDVLSAIVQWRNFMFWNGSDTSLTAPTTLQWMGGLAQLYAAGCPTATVGAGASIIDALKSEVAALMASTTYKVKPSAIALNPLLIDMIEQEAKASHIEFGNVEIVAGVTVRALATQAGLLPLIPDPWMPTDATARFGFAAPPTVNGVQTKNYYAVIMSEKEVEIPVVSGKTYDPKPRLFQLGLTGPLNGQFVGVMFDALVFKGAAYAFAMVAVNR